MKETVVAAAQKGAATLRRVHAAGVHSRRSRMDGHRSRQTTVDHLRDHEDARCRDADAGTHVLAEFLAMMQDDDASWESWTPLGN